MFTMEPLASMERSKHDLFANEQYSGMYKVDKLFVQTDYCPKIQVHTVP